MIYIDKIFISGADMMCLILDVVPTVVYEKTDHKNTFTWISVDNQMSR